MKNEQNARILRDISPKHIFSGILRAILGSEAGNERIGPQQPSFYGRNRAE